MDGLCAGETFFDSLVLLFETLLLSRETSRRTIYLSKLVIDILDQFCYSNLYPTQKALILKGARFSKMRSSRYPKLGGGFSQSIQSRRR